MGIEGHCVLALSSVDAGDGEDGRLSTGMEDSWAKGGSGWVIKEWEKNVARVLIRKDSNDFVGAELE